MVKYPVFVSDQGDLIIFEKDMESGYLEHQDILRNEYRFFDSEGYSLRACLRRTDSGRDAVRTADQGRTAGTDRRIRRRSRLSQQDRRRTPETAGPDGLGALGVYHRRRRQPASYSERSHRRTQVYVGRAGHCRRLRALGSGKKARALREPLHEKGAISVRCPDIA